jgi:hypothetical protein
LSPAAPAASVSGRAGYRADVLLPMVSNESVTEKLLIKPAGRQTPDK